MRSRAETKKNTATKASQTKPYRFWEKTGMSLLHTETSAPFCIYSNYSMPALANIFLAVTVVNVVEKRTRRGGGGPVSDDGCSVSRVVLNFYRQRTDKFKSLAFTFEYNGSCTKPNFLGVSLPNMTENCGGIRITRRLGFHLFADSQPVE